ncbi:hypothetical protein D3C78_339970 [compost metagenome]
MASADPRNSACAVGREQVRRHVRQGCAGIRIIKGEHKDRTGQAFIAIGDIRAVPFHTCGAKVTAKIGWHGHQATICGRLWHFREWRTFRESDHRAVRIIIRSGHTIVAFVQQTKHLFHCIDTARHVGHTGTDHVLLRKIDKINFCIIGHNFSQTEVIQFRESARTRPPLRPFRLVVPST